MTELHLLVADHETRLQERLSKAIGCEVKQVGKTDANEPIFQTVATATKEQKIAAESAGFSYGNWKSNFKKIKGFA